VFVWSCVLYYPKLYRHKYVKCVVKWFLVELSGNFYTRKVYRIIHMLLYYFLCKKCLRFPCCFNSAFALLYVDRRHNDEDFGMPTNITINNLKLFLPFDGTNYTYECSLLHLENVHTSQ
jgi:hypothetical protein